MPLKNENVVQGLPANSPFQVGRSDVDKDDVIEQGIGLPWFSDPAATYLYYDNAVACVLDSGIVVHNRLPQNNPSQPATLSSVGIDDPSLDILIGPGVNLRCQDQYTDIVQRMGHARYWFRLWGQALRAGYRIPIPGITTIGGVKAIPYDRNPQWAFNRILPGGNYSGVIIWHAVWSLWYTTVTPPVNNTIPEVDPSAHISSQTPVPAQMQAPYSQSDGNALSARPARAKPQLQLTPNLPPKIR